VVTITPTGVNAVAVKSRTEARVMVSLHKRQGRDDFGPDPSGQIRSWWIRARAKASAYA